MLTPTYLQYELMSFRKLDDMKFHHIFLQIIIVVLWVSRGVSNLAREQVITLYRNFISQYIHVVQFQNTVSMRDQIHASKRLWIKSLWPLCGRFEPHETCVTYGSTRE